MGTYGGITSETGGPRKGVRPKVCPCVSTFRVCVFVCVCVRVRARARVCVSDFSFWDIAREPYARFYPNFVQRWNETLDNQVSERLSCCCHGNHMKHLIGQN